MRNYLPYQGDNMFNTFEKIYSRIALTTTDKGLNFNIVFLGGLNQCLKQSDVKNHISELQQNNDILNKRS